MRKVVTFTGKKSDAAKAEEQHQGLGCIANNCPLAGTISDSTGGGNWKCWAHDRLEDPSQFPYLTQGINENIWLFKVADKITVKPPYDLERDAKEIDSYLRSKGREDLCRIMKNDGQWSDRCAIEPRGSWAMRLRNAAYLAAFEYVLANWSKAA